MFHNADQLGTTAIATANCDAVTGWNGSICTNFTVTYNPNGATGSVPTDTTIYKPDINDTVTVLNEDGLIKTDHSFTGWKDQAGTSFTV